MTERMVKRYKNFDTSCMPDLLVVLMGNIEDGLIGAGADPGKDYTYLDLARLAMPLILTQWKNDSVHWMNDSAYIP